MFLERIPNKVIYSLPTNISKVIFKDFNQRKDLRIFVKAVVNSLSSEVTWFYVEFCYLEDVQFFFADDLNEALYNYQDTLTKIDWK